LDISGGSGEGHLPVTGFALEFGYRAGPLVPLLAQQGDQIQAGRPKETGRQQNPEGIT
jgi:hypothetical protein